MKKIIEPDQLVWTDLMLRPAIDQSMIRTQVQEIIDDVNKQGDAALRIFEKRFGGDGSGAFLVSEQAFMEAEALVADDLKAAIQLAKTNIERFHRAQMISEPELEVMPGVKCWRRSLPIESVGLYVPGGSAPLFSSLLMLAVPAKIAGCKTIVVCTPADKNGTVHPAILYCARLTGVTQVYKLGGAQAIAAMAVGTASVPRVDKIFGPGNQYVTCAKQLLGATGLAIDLPAGPSELAVYADETAVAKFVAADLLSQAEHGPDSQVVLVTKTEQMLDAVLDEVQRQLNDLPRMEIAKRSLQNSTAICLSDQKTAMKFLNAYAPEHLILACADAVSVAEMVEAAGSVFLGNYSCESAGDYASGTNHTLPTNGYARAYSGVSLESFMKKITFQQLSKEGLQGLGPAIELMAAAEGLSAHKNAVSIRLQELNTSKNEI